MSGLTLDNPAELSYALQSGRLVPGDTLRLRGGTYKSQYLATIAGTSGNPVTIRPYGNEKVIIEGGLKISGPDIILRDLEIRGDWSWWPRDTAHMTNHLEIFGARTKLINCHIHDIAQTGWWNTAIDSEIYGCLFANIGVSGGAQTLLWHSLYNQNNNTGVKKLTNCIFLPGFSDYTIHTYGSASAVLKHYVYDGVVNVGKRWLVGGQAPIADIEIKNCIAYQGDLQLGYQADVTNGAVVNLHDNDFATHLTLVALSDWTMQSNRFRSVALNGSGILSVNWYAAHSESIDGNVYDTPAVAGGSMFSVDGSGTAFPAWQALGYDAGGTARYSSAGIDRVVVQANSYDATRAHILIQNWSQANSVSVDVSGLALTNGAAYRLRNAYNPLVDYTEFAYDGSGHITVSFVGRTVAKPTGHGSELATLDSNFGAWILEAVS